MKRTMTLLPILLVGCFSFSSALVPFLDTSMCDATDTLPVCQLKKAQCSVVDTLLAHPTGPIGGVVQCANVSGVTLGIPFYSSIGIAFTQDTLHTLADSAAAGDTTVASNIRKCTLNATGMLTPDLLLNRTAIAAVIGMQPIPATLAAGITMAAYTCTEPVDFNTKPYLDCVKKACMSSVTVPPFIKSGMPGLIGVGPASLPPSVGDISNALASATAKIVPPAVPDPSMANLVNSLGIGPLFPSIG